MFDSCEIRVHPTGSAIARLGTISQGQGHATTFAQILASEIGIPAENITIEEGDTDTAPYGLGTYGSRSTPVAGAATAMAGEGHGVLVMYDKFYRLSALDNTKFVVAKIVTIRLAGDDFLYLVASGFGIVRQGLAKGALLQNIIDFVIAQQRLGRGPLLIVDEAHHRHRLCRDPGRARVSA
jgi:Molybdopterin-binding domain of aldehyde dehydrogenase